MSANTFTTNLRLPVVSNDTEGGVYEFNRMLLAVSENMYLVVKSLELSNPPASPVEGDAYFVKELGGGAWIDHSNEIAYYFNGWRFIVPRVGMILWDKNKDFRQILIATGWQGGTIIADVVVGVDALDPTTQTIIDNVFTECRLHGLLRQT